MRNEPRNEPLFEHGDRVAWYEAGLVYCTGTVIRQISRRCNWSVKPPATWWCNIEWSYEVSVDRNVMLGVWSIVEQLEEDLRPMGLLDLIAEVTE